MTYETYSDIERHEIGRTRVFRFWLLCTACTLAAVAIGVGGSALTGKVAHLVRHLLAAL